MSRVTQLAVKFAPSPWLPNLAGLQRTPEPPGSGPPGSGPPGARPPRPLDGSLGLRRARGQRGLSGRRRHAPEGPAGGPAGCSVAGAAVGIQGRETGSK